jgi:hypothetical protein
MCKFLHLARIFGAGSWTLWMPMSIQIIEKQRFDIFINSLCAQRKRGHIHGA